MNVDADTVSLFSHHLMAVGFSAALLGTLSIRRYGYATIFLIALVETYVSFRYQFHLAVRDQLLGSAHDAAMKTTLQFRLLFGTALAGCVILAGLFYRLSGASVGRRMMAFGISGVLAIFAVELISVHVIDRVIYAAIGPFALCAIAYFGAAALATCGALVERRREAGFSAA